MNVKNTEELQEFIDMNAGYCKKCDSVTVFDGVEPDAEGYSCEVCGTNSVMGIENALIMGLIE